MTAGDLSARAMSLWEGLELAAQGAYGSSRPVGAAVSPGARTRASERFHDASLATAAAMTALLNDFALQITAGSDQLQAVLQEKGIALRALADLYAQVRAQVSKAIHLGTASGPASMLKGADGAIGQLVARQHVLSLRVRDTSGRTWQNPLSLVRAIVRGFAVQAEVIVSLAAFQVAGYAQVYVGAHLMSIADLAETRRTIFHPNSKELPRVDLPT